MTEIVIVQRMWQRRGTAAEWSAQNPVLASGEVGVELGATPADPQRFKIGNGTSLWADLPWAGDSGDGSNWFSGSALPPAALGEDGDQYLRTGTGAGGGDVYAKVSGTWTLTGNIRGPVGPQGNPGPNGLSAYQVAVANGFAGTQAAWLESLVGEVGPRGPAGPPGIPSQRRVLEVPGVPTGSFVCDWSAYDEIRMLLVTDTTLSFSGALDGQGCVLKLRQDSVGGHAVSLPSAVRFNGVIGVWVPTAAAGRGDKLGFAYDDQDSVYDFVSAIPGV